MLTRLTRRIFKTYRSTAAFAVVSMYLMAVNLSYYRRALLQSEHRQLARDLGGGECDIEPLADFEEAPADATKTLLTSYPGSGKRFTWQVIRGLTNYEVADDWDFSGYLKHSPLTVKTSWPHKQGVWSWEDEMDQVILLIRNPRWALPSYHTMRYELDYSDSWLSTFQRLGFAYTLRPNINVWKAWRDEHFEEEVQAWADHVDFWMSGGKPTGAPIQHPRCITNKIDCNPKVVLDFDEFYQENPTVTFFKLSEILDNTANVEIIAAQARVCVLDKVYTDKSLHDASRDGNGPAPTVYRFPSVQLKIIDDKIKELIAKYEAAPWDTNEIAQSLVTALRKYQGEVEAETQFEEMMESFYGYSA